MQLAGDPVTVADANASAPLTDGQKDSLRSQLRAAQAPVESQVRSHGGHVLASYQSSYNGFKVQIAADQAASLASLPGVVAVHPLELVMPSNTNGIPLIGAPQVWDGLNGLHGEGIKIADIDTGIDYTHADFGGTGNPTDYQTALASDALPATAASFGPTAPKVKGGYDFVGDSYNPSADPSSPDYQPTPQPDPNPLDCNSHGTHTAGTMAGFGVTALGHTYTGAYNATTVSGNTWLVGPGVAPRADIYALKVFGCAGGTNEVIDAIEWAVDHNMDVINMSLGSPFGSADSPDAVAAENAAHDGVIVVASSGNEGSSPYVTGTPGSGDDVISVAANDPAAQFPAVTMSLSGGAAVTALNGNGLSPTPAGPFHIRVIHSASGAVSLGCSVAADTAGGAIAPNTIIVVRRGTCARAAKAIFGQQAGAAGVAMLNTSPPYNGYPPYDGPISGEPRSAGTPLIGGFLFTVTIPFLGIAAADVPTILAADGTTTTLAGGLTVPNPGFKTLASFSSQGPRSGDSFLKPNVTAPGVGIFSAAMGQGTSALNDSGTSMAAPHVTGTAALVKQAHPDWRKVKYWDAAIENTADPSGVSNYTTRGAGTGLVQALPAVQTQVVAIGDKDMGVLNYGFNELTRDFNETDVVHLRNFGDSWATFNVADSARPGEPALGLRLRVDRVGPAAQQP